MAIACCSGSIVTDMSCYGRIEFYISARLSKRVNYKKRVKGDGILDNLIEVQPQKVENKRYYLLTVVINSALGFLSLIPILAALYFIQVFCTYSKSEFLNFGLMIVLITFAVMIFVNIILYILIKRKDIKIGKFVLSSTLPYIISIIILPLIGMLIDGILRLIYYIQS